MIPTKNEVRLIPRLLTSLMNQDYSRMSNTSILVADANSTDGTADAALFFRKHLDIRVIAGGIPSIGRNHGAALADTPYVLFIDADIELADRSLIRRCLERAAAKQLHCVTTNILCREGNWIDRLFYAINDAVQYASYFHRPFATGMFMLWQRTKFWDLGGFHEQILFAEDYRLSQKVDRKRFAVVRGGVYTTNRRFKRMGHLRVGLLFLKTAMNYWNEEYFLRDHKYWAESEPRA
ncbi:MAG TPA: glycosyltransferase [Candidatus Sulfotelmatobacter sp.]|nr:glycosyltransferase [Candidatus Sulfotelmatobacter sp.]